MKTAVLSLMATSVMASELIDIQGLWGVGAKVQEGVYKDTQNSYSVAPYIFGSLGVLNIEANRADITLYGNGLIYTSIVGQYRSVEARDKESVYGERKGAVELGLQVGLILGNDFVLRSSYMYDVTKTHNGVELDTQLFRHDSFGDFFLLSSVGIQYLSSNLTRYYYKNDTYTPGEAFSAELELILTYSIDKLGLFVGTRNYMYSKEISDSPIVSQNYTLQLFSGVGYNF